MRIFKALSLFIAVCTPLLVFSQNRPIGYWRSHLPYNSSVGVATDGITLYVATKQSFYTYNLATEELTPYSKVEGMSDVGMACIGYDTISQTAVLAYANGNIDLFTDGSFHNIPDLKLKSVTGSKKINDIYTENGYAYLSTDIGIIVIDLDKREVKETYTFYKNNQVLNIFGFTGSGSYFYTVTSKGLYRAPKNNINLQAFSTWYPIDSTRDLLSVAAAGDKIYTISIDSCFFVNNNSLQFIYASDSSFRHVDAGLNGVWVSENYKKTFTGKVKKLNYTNVFVDSFIAAGFPKQVIEPISKSVWIADELSGLKKRDTLNTEYYGTIIPEGPNTETAFDIYANNNELWVAHGGYDQFYVFGNNKYGFSNFNNEKWKSYELYQYVPFGDSTHDFTEITKGTDGTVYAGSNQDGLFELHPDGSYVYYKQNSILDESITAPGKYRVSGLDFDNDGNLWLCLLGSYHELVVKTKDGNWYEFTVPISRAYPHGAAHLIVDNNGLKWFASPNGGGLLVYDDNGTIEDPTDDRYTQLLAGKGVGGLPDNEVYCIAEDKNGAIWIGTGNGIGIINCPTQVISRQCESELRVVQYDQFAGYLFQNEVVRALAVDGANRKWIGTNNGVWLISPDGDKIIYRFTVDNSPLPSNHIQKISIDPVIGTVYISTEEGMVSYRSGAIDGGTENTNVKSFPNPVPSGYKGTIAIRGLVENADVRITDISGQLVFRTKALGGQAVWNGLDYTGHRPQTGVYLIFITNKDGSQTHVGKLVFVE